MPTQYVTCALYKFVALPNYGSIRHPLLKIMTDNQVFGTLLLASEGINGTISGTRASIDTVLHWLAQQPGLDNIDTKESYDDNIPFYRTKVKLKKEIVTMGVEGIDPNQVVGTYVKPADWNALISDPDVLVVDTRNNYEVEIGTFKDAVNPNTTSFREFPAWATENIEPDKTKKIAMFCTGGIRCEKSTAFLKEQGFDEVYHLEGGILKYLEEVPQEDSLWQGECFVFDNRVTVDHQLRKGNFDQCHACRRPITEADKRSPHYQAGVSCHHCYDECSEEQKRRFAQREKQIKLAQRRGEQHLGGDQRSLIEGRRRQKLEQKNAQREQDRSTGQ